MRYPNIRQKKISFALGALTCLVGLLAGCGGSDSTSTQDTDSQGPVFGVSSITPATGTVGTELTIMGSQFRPGVQATIGGIAMDTVVLASDTQIVATVPNGTSLDIVLDVVVQNSDGTQVALPGAFTTVAPVLDSVSRASKPSGNAGSIVILEGDAFGDLQGSGQVMFSDGAGGQVASLVSGTDVWTNTFIATTVPAGAEDGPVSVRTATGESGSLMLLDNRPRIIQHDFDWFTVWVDCNERGPIAFQYWVSKDNGNHEATSETWRLADNVPNGCEMSSGGLFARPAAQPQYDRGHLVDPNVMDNRTAAITDTYHRINMAPQARQFNRDGGAWRHTEKIVDCYRDIATLAVWGGIIYGNNDPANDHFVGSHGIRTAERWWKMIYRQDTNQYIAWIFDNVNSESVDTMPQRRVMLDELKDEIEFIPYFHLAEGGQNSSNDWPVTGGQKLMCEGHTTASA